VTFYVPETPLSAFHFICGECDVRWVGVLRCWICNTVGARLTASNDMEYGTTFVITGGRWDPGRKAVPISGGVADCMDLDKESMNGCP
jgi:hypothetical protein